MRKITSKFIPFIVILSLVVGISPNTTPVKAWGLVTHTYLTTEAINRVEVAWAEIFDFYSIELHQGALYPDVVLQDWDNHLYYPDDPTNKTGPSTINTTLELAISQFNAREWADGFFRLGIASHYIEDLNIPIHTGEFYGGDTIDLLPIHQKIERDINDAIGTGNFILSPQNPILLNSTYSAEDFAIDQAIKANAFRSDVMMVYPDETSNGLSTNTTYFDMIKGQLEEAVFSVGTLFKTAVAGLIVPDLRQPGSLGSVVIDKDHNGDYTSSRLVQVADDLGRTNEVLFNFNAINALDTRVHTLIITAPGIGYSAQEIIDIQNWLAGGPRNIILTSRGDFSQSLLRSSLNDILVGVNSQIRVNDDNVYTSNPEAFFPSSATNGYTWYNEPTTVQNATDTFGITADVTSVQFFSPSSLYFTSTNENLTVLIYGDPYAFQLDEGGDPIAFVWDDIMDSTGGDTIPLAAAEIIGDDKIVVYGSTAFSDFDYGRIESVLLLHNIMDWFDPTFEIRILVTTTETVSTTITEISTIFADNTNTVTTAAVVTLLETTTTTVSTAAPVPIIAMIGAILFIPIFIRRFRR